jgi:isopenicillin N synthase-like dioxygenase
VLTILGQDDVGGLEVLTKDGQWIAAPPIPGTFVVNIGDMLETWTCGTYSTHARTHHCTRTCTLTIAIVQDCTRRRRIG